MPELYKRNSNIKCLVCGKWIYRRPIELKRSNNRAYCSWKCYGISCRKEISCIVCGKLIFAGLHKKTCSRACANIHRTGIKYNTGGRRDKVKTQQALKMRLLLERGISCERCGYSKYEILQVHHKDRDRENNELNNLELICPNCHYEEHFLEGSWLKNKFGRVG